MRVGLIGHPLGHSFSKLIHQRIAPYDYTLIDVPQDRFESFMRAPELDAFNVTIPYKKQVIPFCYSLSDAARRIQSVNTVIRSPQGRLYGDNTDYDGFLYLCRRAGISLADARVVIAGSGGTSRTVQAAAQDMGAREIAVLSREGRYHYGNLALLADFDILVNTTPVGMFPHTHASPLDLTVFRRLRAVIDVIYNPFRTRLLDQAQKKGIQSAGGLPMLVAQAVYAAGRFMGTTPDTALIETTLAQCTAEMLNIVLIGMPGSGKSAVGAQVARLLNRPLIDTDSAVEKAAQQSIPGIFASRGEAAFRQLESEAVMKICTKNSQVIATGGGAVLNETNRHYLRQNGVVFWLQRDLALLETKGRPLSKDRDALKTILAQRQALYDQCCDVEIDNNGECAVAAQRILESFAKFMEQI